MNIKKIKNNNWFTLVELIVIITILAVLATIAFISFSNYTKNSRDSNRLVTVSNIEKSLNIYNIWVQKYPEPEKISWTWTINWKELVYVWVLWDKLSKVLKISETPKDPLTWEKYIYWVSSDYRKFQIWTIQEEQSIWYQGLINKTYASSSTLTSKVVWNYDWILKYSSWWTCVANIPSLLFATWWKINLLSQEAWFIVNKWANIPNKIKNTNKEVLKSVSNTWAITFECLSSENAWEEQIKTNPLKYETNFWQSIEKVWKETIWVEKFEEIKDEVKNKIEEEKWMLWLSTLPSWNYNITSFEPLFEPLLYNNKIYILLSSWLNLVSYDINTQEIKNLTQVTTLKQCGSTPVKNFVNIGNKIYFSLCWTKYWNDSKLISYDISNNTLVDLPQINNVLSFASNLLSFKNKLYFSANDWTYWIEMWEFTPSSNSLNRITNINTNWDSRPRDFTVLWDKIYFRADDPVWWNFKIRSYDTSSNLVSDLNWEMKTITWWSTFRDINAPYWVISNLWNWLLWYIPNYVSTMRVWYYNPTTNVATVVYDNNILITPAQDKLLWIWNKIYFIWKDSSESYLNLYEYDRITNTYSKKTNLSWSVASNTWWLIEKWWKIYFTNTNSWVRTLYEYDTNTSQLSIIDTNVWFYSIRLFIWDSLYYVKWSQLIRKKF